MFNEVFNKNKPRVAYKDIVSWANSLPYHTLIKKKIEAENLFKKIGIKDISFKIDESKILNLMTCYGDVDIFSKDLAIRNTDIFSNNPSLKEVNLYNR